MITQYLSALVDKLRAEGVDDPLAHSFMLAALWDDLAAIAGEPPPDAIRAVLGDATHLRSTQSDVASVVPALSRKRGDLG